MRRVVIYSFLVEATVSVVLVFTFKLASDLWGTDGFGAWTLARRIISFALPLLTIGIEVGMPRFIAYDSHQPAANYLLAGSALALGGTAATTLALLGAPDFFSFVLFGDSSLRRLLGPLCALLAAYAAHIVWFAYIRGQLRILEANLLHLWAFGFAPLIAFHAATQSPEHAMTAMAILVTLPALLLTAAELVRRKPAWRAAFGLIPPLAHFGVSRMMAALSLTALALLPPLIAARTAGLTSAGVVALGITLIGFSGTLMAPIALSLLPASARQSGRGDIMALQRSLHLLELLALPCAAAAMALIWFSAPMLAEMFVASEARLATRVLRIAGAGAGAYAMFALMRSILDAVTHKPRVLQSTIAAVAVFALTWLAGAMLDVESTDLSMLAYTAAIVALTVSVYFAARRELRLQAGRERQVEDQVSGSPD